MGTPLHAIALPAYTINAACYQTQLASLTFEINLTSPGSEAPTLYGHFAYSEAPRSDLVEVGNQQKLRRAAARAFRQMVAAAARQRVAIAPLSGFRDKYTQHQLFYGVAAKRGQSWQERAKVSAPPGYSEHHTGYALDLGDGSFPGRNLGESFENTPAFRWLLVNAESYGFEMSFPRNNPQGVGYEPWHWRFVGDAHSQETFKAARSNQLLPR